MIAQLLDAERARFQKSPIDAERVIAVGEYPVTHDLDPGGTGCVDTDSNAVTQSKRSSNQTIVFITHYAFTSF